MPGQKMVTAAKQDAISAKESIQRDEKAESERDLGEFLKNELTACVTFVKLGATMRKSGNQELVEQAIGNAEKSYATLLPFLSDSTRSTGLMAEELEEFRAQLERIRNSLDDLEKVRRVAVLAYEYWQERGCPHGSSEEDWFRAEREIGV
jgi:hypothetical protein